MSDELLHKTLDGERAKEWALEAISDLAGAIHDAAQGRYATAQNTAEHAVEKLNVSLILAHPLPNTFHVRMHYFKPSGEWYTEAVWLSRGGYKAYDVLVDEVKQLRANGELPDLRPGDHSEYTVLIIDVPEHPRSHPVLLRP